MSNRRGYPAWRWVAMPDSRPEVAEPRHTAGRWYALYRLPARSQALDRFRLAFGREPGQCDYDPNEVGWWVGPITPAEMEAYKKRWARQMALEAMMRTGEAALDKAGER